MGDTTYRHAFAGKPPVAREPAMRNSYANLWIWLFLCPLAMDYKAVDDNSSHLAQVLLTLPTLGAGLALWLIAPRFAVRSKLRSFVTFSLILCVPASVITQLIQGNDFGNYMRVLLPFALFMLGYLACCRPWQDSRIEQIEKAMFWANVICMLFTFVYGLATGGALEDVRYRIVSPTFLALQAVLLHEFVIAKRFTPFTLALFMGTIVVELLSVTRSLLLGTALLFALATWMSAPSPRYLVRAGMRAFATAVVIIGMAFAGMQLFPGVGQHWTQRILFASEDTKTGKDPTTITRLAEIQDQYDQTIESPTTILTGVGYGHIYHYSPKYLPDLAGQMSKKDFYAVHDWAAGHNFWVYQFFAGGVLFGILMPIAVLIALYKCCGTYRRWRSTAPAAPYLPVLGRAILVTAALPATSIGGNPLGPRFSGLVFGVSLGLMIAMYVQLKRLAATHPHRAAPQERRRKSQPRREPHFAPTRDTTVEPQGRLERTEPTV